VGIGGRVLHGTTPEGHELLLRDALKGGAGEGIEEPHTLMEGQTVLIGGNSRGLYHVNVSTQPVVDADRSCVTRRGSNPQVSTKVCAYEGFICFTKDG
jgi:hypothetical protein